MISKTPKRKTLFWRLCIENFIEARKVFEHFNMLGSHVDVVGTTKEDIKVPIHCKLVGLHEALKKNFD
jgi:hypothetical protein